MVYKEHWSHSYSANRSHTCWPVNQNGRPDVLDVYLSSIPSHMNRTTHNMLRPFFRSYPFEHCEIIRDLYFLPWPMALSIGGTIFHAVRKVVQISPLICMTSSCLTISQAENTVLADHTTSVSNSSCGVPSPSIPFRRD